MSHTPTRDGHGLAYQFLMANPVLALESRVAGQLLPLVEQIADGRTSPAALRDALPERQVPPAPPRAGTSPIAVLDLVGILTPRASLFTWLGLGTSLDAFMRDLKAAAADPDVTTIGLLVDSPGGSVTLCAETAALLRQVRAQKRVVALVAGYDCSAAYWLTSNANKVIATHSATIGSIGVLGERTSVARRLDREGVDVTLFTTSDAKRWGHPAVPMTDEERAYLQARVTATGADFERDVAAGRRVSVDVVRARFGQGRTFSATEAQQRGMVDAVVVDLDAALAAEVARPAVQASLDARRAALTHTALAHARAQLSRVALAPHRARLTALTARRGGVRS